MNATGQRRAEFEEVYRQHGLAPGFLSDPRYRKFYTSPAYRRSYAAWRALVMLGQVRYFLRAHQRGEAPPNFHLAELQVWLREVEDLLRAIE